MIEDNGVKFVNLNGQTLLLNNDTWPLTSFEPEGSMKSTPVERSQESGEWPTRSIPGALLIPCGGDLIKNTSGAYIAERMRAMNILVPAGVVETERKMGTLTLSFTDFEPMYNDCTLDDIPHLPMRALYPSVTEFLITFKVFDGYMIGRNTGRFYTI